MLQSLKNDFRSKIKIPFAYFVYHSLSMIPIFQLQVAMIQDEDAAIKMDRIIVIYKCTE